MEFVSLNPVKYWKSREYVSHPPNLDSSKKVVEVKKSEYPFKFSEYGFIDQHLSCFESFSFLQKIVFVDCRIHMFLNLPDHVEKVHLTSCQIEGATLPLSSGIKEVVVDSCGGPFFVQYPSDHELEDLKILNCFEVDRKNKKKIGDNYFKSFPDGLKRLCITGAAITDLTKQIIPSGTLVTYSKSTLVARGKASRGRAQQTPNREQMDIAMDSLSNSERLEAQLVMS